MRSYLLWEVLAVVLLLCAVKSEVTLLTNDNYVEFLNNNSSLAILILRKPDVNKVLLDNWSTLSLEIPNITFTVSYNKSAHDLVQYLDVIEFPSILFIKDQKSHRFYGHRNYENLKSFLRYRYSKVLEPETLVIPYFYDSMTIVKMFNKDSLNQVLKAVGFPKPNSFNRLLLILLIFGSPFLLGIILSGGAFGFYKFSEYQTIKLMKRK